MSYNIQTAGTNHAVHLQVSSATSVSAGGAVPYAIVTSTSGHGISVSNGVITLPAGEWVVHATVETSTLQAFEAQWYIDGAANADFPKVAEYTGTNTSNLGSSAAVLQGSKTIELRVDASVTVSAFSDLLIYGVRI